MRKVTQKEKENIPFYLHESVLIDHKITANDLILRFGLECSLNSSLDDDYEFGEYYYIYDAVCRNFKDLEMYFKKGTDLYFTEILAFYVHNNKFWLEMIDYDCHMYFNFDCDKIEWKPIILLTGDEAENIDSTPYHKIK